MVESRVLTANEVVMLTWWGDGRGRPSNDLGYWLSLYATLGVLQDALVIGLIA